MARASTKLVVRGGTVVLPNQTIANGAILLEDGYISSIQESAKEFSGVETLDLDGLTILPGFIDVHIHGAVGVDVMEASPAGLREVALYLASQGVTSWLPTLVPGSDENYASVAAAVSQVLHESKGAR